MTAADSPRRDQSAALMGIGEKYQPHWVWFLACVVAPVTLLLISVVGIGLGSPIPLGLAAAAPKLGVSIAAVGLAAALVRRRKEPIAIAALGVALTGSGFLLLMWLTRPVD